MNFDRLVKYYLTEMPHISMDLPDGKHIDFDLELEYIKSLDDLKDLFKRVLSGTEIKSRRGLLVKLSTEEEKIAFMHEIKDFLTFFLQKRFNITLTDFYKSLAGPTA
jgi:bacterioferritin (cytochrome b1)